MTNRPKDTTPAMRQYLGFKQKHPDCVLFFRMGDFYELFYEDAQLAHKVLGVALTQRSEGIPMAGVPYHAVETYLHRMIKAGYRAAVCDQIEDPAHAKGVVKRDVTRVITPGTLTDESLLAEGRENPLVALVAQDHQHALVAWAELSTGSFFTSIFTPDELADELARIAPRELLHLEDDSLIAKIAGQSVAKLAKQVGAVPTARPVWHARQDESLEVIKRQYQVGTVQGFGFHDDDPLLRPVALIIHYLLETQRTSSGSDRARIAHMQPPRRFNRHEHLIIDPVSLRSLEIDRTLHSGSVEGSLLGVLQGCVTAMGKRMLRHWLCYPLRDRPSIERRQRVVTAMVDDVQFLEQVRKVLGHVQDVPRTVARLAVGRAGPRDLVSLGRSGAQATALESLLAGRPALEPYTQALHGITVHLSKLADTIAAACIEAPPAHLRDGGLIRDGYDDQLDEYRGHQRDSQAWLVRYQKQLIDQTAIQSLKVAFNKVFGYYIEVTAANKHRAPNTWSRKQTLKNAERFITPELKDFEGKVLSAEQRAVAREQALFTHLSACASEQLHHLQVFAEVAAAIDVLSCFARRAIRSRYVRPEIRDEPTLHITGGRHPVLDEVLGDQFVPNDVAMGKPAGDTNTTNGTTLALITGPNMAGKSTYIRQTALIVLLAHTGSCVPADAATIGLCDRIFTRVGASDELHAGRSTFMVEMTETANICHHATAASIVILDEIGRGTSTLDGLSLAWALAEHLAERGCQTLFATHYHELTSLADSYSQVVNLNVTVREWQDQIVFLHCIKPGATDRSYGIHVAKIAGLPVPVVQRANELLAELEVNHHAAPTHRTLSNHNPMAIPHCGSPDGQLSLFTEFLAHPAVEALQRIDLNHLSPIAAMDELRRIQGLAINSTHDEPSNAKAFGLEPSQHGTGESTSE